MDRKFITEQEKDKIGRKCCNCETTEDLQYHHIVPLALGGRDIVTNIICICFKCHTLLHRGVKTNINFSETVKAGMEKARATGKQIGRKKGDKIITKKSIEAKKKILELNYSFNGNLTNEETYKQIGINKSTFYTYKKQLKEEIKNKTLKGEI